MESLQKELERLAGTSGVLRAGQATDGQSIVAILAGRGLTHVDPATGLPGFADRHEILIRAAEEVDSPAWSVQFATPLLHPNVPPSGRVSASDVGLPAKVPFDLEMWLERLWDVVRGAYVDLVENVNPAATQLWIRSSANRPWDGRPLVDRRPEMHNVVVFRRKDAARTRPRLRHDHLQRPGDDVLILK
jgi:hypothetical protein